MERAVIIARDETLADVARFLAPGGADHAVVDLTLPFREAKARVVEEFERAYVGGLLEAHGGKLTAAARHADMDHEELLGQDDRATAPLAGRRGRAVPRARP